MQNRNFIHISQFNEGQASKIFDRVNTEQLVVLEDNLPTAIILSIEEYQRLCKIEENYKKHALANFLTTEPVSDDFGAEILKARKDSE